MSIQTFFFVRVYKPRMYFSSSLSLSESIKFVGGGYRVSSGLYLALDLTFPICFMHLVNEKKRKFGVNTSHCNLQKGYDADFDLVLGPCVQRHALPNKTRVVSLVLVGVYPGTYTLVMWVPIFRCILAQFTLTRSRVISCG